MRRSIGKRLRICLMLLGKRIRKERDYEREEKLKLTSLNTRYLVVIIF